MFPHPLTHSLSPWHSVCWPPAPHASSPYTSIHVKQAGRQAGRQRGLSTVLLSVNDAVVVIAVADITSSRPDKVVQPARRSAEREDSATAVFAVAACNDWLAASGLVACFWPAILLSCRRLQLALLPIFAIVCRKRNILSNLCAIYNLLPWPYSAGERKRAVQQV